ncbi:MAG: hypothetical protein GF365_00090 [Candidatus Buchananbacteria bacterium]|nr:hypothetical protein [Candidatus Buchananbacteria bacterium]
MPEIICQAIPKTDKKCQICGQLASLKISYGDCIINSCHQCQNKAIELIYTIESNFQE